MNVIPDTCIWSESLRKRKGDPAVIQALRNLLLDERVEIIGPVRQEILSGISATLLFESVKSKLCIFDDLPLRTIHFEMAADFSNQCRRAGIQGSPADFLICAASKLSQLSIFTTDADFLRFEKILGLNLYEIP